MHEHTRKFRVLLHGWLLPWQRCSQMFRWFTFIFIHFLYLINMGIPTWPWRDPGFELSSSTRLRIVLTKLKYTDELIVCENKLNIPFSVFWQIRLGCYTKAKLICHSPSSFFAPQTYLDVDECIQGTHTCKIDEVCINKNGGFDCAEDDCEDGYRFSNLTGRCTGTVLNCLLLRFQWIFLQNHSCDHPVTCTTHPLFISHGSVV